jgi:phospholipid transport system substrate-binding protein
MRLWMGSLALLLLTATAYGQIEPQQLIEQLIAEYRTMKPGADHELSPQEREHNEQVRERMLGHLDVEKLGQLALQDHWASLSEAQRADYLQTLRSVLEERSLRNVRGTSERFEVQYEGVDSLPGGDALVKSVLEVKAEEYFVDFKLEPREGSWVIYDVITDDVSTVRNYRDQFNKIIAEKGFDELMRRMRENLLEEAPAATAAKPGAR